MNISPMTPRKQQGSMLLEALISILIFSIGILAVIGLQASSIKLSSDAKYRSDASMLANQYLATMWVDIASAATASTPFNQNEFVSYNSGGATFTPWFNNLASTLPSASAVVTAPGGGVLNPVLLCDNNPCSILTGVLQTSRTDVSINISWHLPDCNPVTNPSCVHTYSTNALISAQKQL